MDLSSCMRRCFVLLAAVLNPAIGLAGTRFVDAGSTNSVDDGTSWARAYRGPNGLRKAIESGRFRVEPARDERLALLRRLTEVEGLERYLRRSFLGQKQFSLEGLDVLIPMLDDAIGIWLR